MKKIIAALFTIVLLMSPIGDFVFHDQVTTVEAKKYKSGKKSFNPSNSGIQSNKNNSNSQTDKNDTMSNNKSTTKDTTNSKGGFMSGGLMKGLMLGGLAGLLFGGLLGNMGVLGSILGLFVNVLTIVAIIWLVAKIFTFFKRKEEAKAWKN